MQKALEHSEADWDQVVDTNLKGAWLMAREVGKHLIALDRPGRIINIAWIVGLRTMAGLSSYAASKAGLIHLTHAMALELGIRVERESAARWVRRALADRPAGHATVVYHSVVLQYFGEEERRSFIGALAAAGTEATAERPLAWLRLEYDEAVRQFVLRLTSWPGGEDRVLVHAHAHGSWVQWKA